MKRRVLLLLAFLVGLVTCSCFLWRQDRNPYPRQPLFPREFAPPANYQSWYESAERCVGLKGNFAEVHWFISPLPWGDTTYAQFYVYRDGKGFPRQAEITISAHLWLDSLIVMHESIHHILWKNGWTAPPEWRGITRGERQVLSHPSPPFGKCAPAFYPWPTPPPKDST